MHKVLISIVGSLVIGFGGVLAVTLVLDEPLMGLPPTSPEAPPVPDDVEGIAQPTPAPDDVVDAGLDTDAAPEPPATPTTEDEPAVTRRFALEPPEEGAYLGTYAPGLIDDEGIAEWNEATGAELAIAHWYQGWGDDRNELYHGWLENTREQGAVPMISWEPWEKPEGAFTDPDQPEFRLSRIADGAYDDYIEEWAEVAAEDGGPMLVRFAHEMNGFWYPWSVTENANTPQDYVEAWRHVHDVARDAGATNIRWVWAVNTLAGLPPEQAELDFEDFYPGDEYVDWVSIVGFNYGTSRDWSVWRTAEQIFDDTYAELEGFGKPIMISETGTVPQGGDEGAWVQEALRTFEEDYPAVRAVVWFNAPRAEDIDFGLQGDALEHFREEVQASEHWQARPELVELPAPPAAPKE